ncbi:hypothetical protein M407DRAFT_67253 [Tulasnella calospora MUT 4182]|uniref:F-box domain-containing protein n=1 Tax=Tulasnella calospora MUT 4182 TaxID=1051891 RepID=A0A0C3QSN6_9AGAM|nr:hypothetical protein M407DRAFT_67253 [Tulasnella calospora MUT 4182]
MLLTDLPVELLLDHVLPALDLPSLLALAQTSKFFSALCSDDTFWRLKLRRDYNFTSNADTARESGWKVIYKGIRRPSVYTWGNAGQGRLGVKGLPKQYRSGVPFPVKVNIKARIVSLVAGGWSFHALDDAGRIYVWGQLQGEGYAMRQDGFSESVKGASTPHRLQVNYPASEPTDEAASHPVKFTALSCGRAHSAALDSKNNAWLFTSWGRPIELTSPLIHDTQNPDEKLVQVECGWGFVSMLNESGTVYVLWPLTEAEEFKRVMDNLNETLDESGEHKASAIEVEGEDVIPCSSLAIAASPLVLPPIPDDLPDLSSADPASESFEATVVLVRIGAGDDFLVGLTNKGHVLSIDLTGGGDRAPQGSEWLREQWRTRRRPGWVYLPQYSDVEQVKQNPVFASDSGVLPPTKMKITHIAAHYNSFTAYSVSTSTSPHASLVLLGKKDTTAPTHELTFPQTIYLSLLQESIIALQLGDYHQAALASNGKLYTWGKFSDGALGLGDPVDLPLGAPGGYTRQEDLNVARDGRRWATPEGVSDPSAVRFDHLIKKDDQLGGERKPSKKFVVSVAASGWHTGALVIDLDGDTAEENAGLKGKAVVKNEDGETFAGWYPPPVGRPMPGGWPHQLPSTGVPHAANQPPAEHDSHDPYSTFETPGFNPHPSGNPATSSSAHHPLPGHGPAVQRDGAGGGPPLAPRFGLALERGRGGLRGHVGRVPPGLAAFMPQHPPAPPGPEGYPEHRGSEE